MRFSREPAPPIFNQVFGAVVMAAGILFAVVSEHRVGELHRLAREGQEAVGQILSVQRSYSTRGHLKGWSVSYTFSTGAGAMTVKSWGISDFDVDGLVAGARVRVRYLPGAPQTNQPELPSQSALEMNEAARHAPSGIMLGILGFGIMSWGFIQRHRQRQL